MNECGRLQNPRHNAAPAASESLADKIAGCGRFEAVSDLIDVWPEMQQSAINDAIKRWRSRLHACI